MPHRLHDRPAPEHRDASQLPGVSEATLDSLYAESSAAQWGLTPGQFAVALERSLRKRFQDIAPPRDRLVEYLQTLYLRDLALAAACLEGSESAWEYFVREYRSPLRVAAGAITKGSRAGANAQELADSLFAELFGLVDGKRGQRSLFRYFHGRSSLKTWLRAILAQRHVDQLRESRRWESFDQGDGEEPKPLPERHVVPPSVDPHRERYLQRFVAALQLSLASLERSDRQRLELYYAQQQTLAEIGRQIGEHESSVSRHLERIRHALRARIEEHLHGDPAFSEAEIALCFQYAAEDAPIDFRNLFPEKQPGKPGLGRKESS
ncbi:MAG TPA: sigma-70 family RNA polymerase sigma factor [Candidatus Sulfotelmatobacter sp.]|nr:sigma-70 family RNA polymerase sigma factor [Candidatus Sulfotelmatobacter sp.]